MKRHVLWRVQSRNWRRLKSLLAAVAIGLGCVQTQADTLWEVYQQALDNDPQLAADRATYRAGLEAKNLGRAGLLPQIRASANGDETRTDYTRSRTNRAEGSGYSVNVDQTLFDVAAWFNYQNGKLESESAAVQFGAAQQNMMIRVAESYFEVLLQADDLETARNETSAQAAQLEKAQRRYEAGIVAIVDVYDARAAHDSSTARLLLAQDGLLNSFDELSVLTGLQHETIAPLVSDFSVALPVPADRSAWVAFALSNNFALRVARLEADAARYSARASASEHLPTLSGTLSYGKSKNNDSNDIIEPVNSIDNTKTARITLTVPIFSGGGTSAKRREARNQAFKAEDMRNLAERNTIKETRKLHRSVVTDVSRVSALQRTIVSASTALDATKAGYEVGVRTLADVLQAQRPLYQARRDYSSALYSYILNTLKLKKEAGLLTPDDLQQLETELNSGASISRTIAADAGTAR